MNAPATPDDITQRLQALFDMVPAPLEPPDLSALDGFLCAVLLMPRGVEAERWLPFVADVEGRPAPRDASGAAPAWLTEMQALARRRHAELEQAIAARRWFDPWIAELAPAEPVRESILPWVAGFANAVDRFDAHGALDDQRLLEPVALLYLHFDPDDLEDAGMLLETIEQLEPPADLAEAAEDVVCAVLRIADVTRPLPAAPRAPSRRPARRRPRAGAGGKTGGRAAVPPKRAAR